jgi:hypothetical protein
MSDNELITRQEQAERELAFMQQLSPEDKTWVLEQIRQDLKTVVPAQ